MKNETIIERRKSYTQHNFLRQEVQVCPNAQSMVFEVLTKELKEINELIVKYPNPRSGARPLNYKKKRNHDNAMEEAKDIIERMLAQFNEKKTLPYFDFIEFSKMYPIYTMYSNHYFRQRIKTTKEGCDTFVENATKYGVIQF